jgi:hypothetical protein
VTTMSRPQRYAEGRMLRNTLKRGGLGAGASLAIKAAVIVCALASHACLVPQSVDPIPESVHPRPHFVVESIPSYYLLSPMLQLYRQGPADQIALPPCHCRLELSIPLVEVDDPTITLEAHWFVDYDPAVPRLAAPVQSETLQGSFTNPGTVRSLTAYEFDADALGISTNGVHVVTVVLGEQGGCAPAPTALPNRDMRPGYSADEHTFVVGVKVDQDSTRPRCPDVLPSVRVCQ